MMGSSALRRAVTDAVSTTSQTQRAVGEARVQRTRDSEDRRGQRDADSYFHVKRVNATLLGPGDSKGFEDITDEQRSLITTATQQNVCPTPLPFGGYREAKNLGQSP